MTTTPLISPQAVPPLIKASPRRWNPRSIAILVLAWFVLQIGGLFTPGLLDDVDSVYIEIAREMLHRHDYVTPYVNGIRFFDKPPLMYWMAAGSMHLFGIHDWAARLPLALSVLALLIAVYALGIRLFAEVSPATHPDRGGFYAALALATSIGPYLYTRFFIPDILLALWMTLAVHLFLIALDRIHIHQKIHDSSEPPQNRVPHVRTLGRGFYLVHQSPLLPCLAFAAVMALNVLTKGLIGLVFPVGFVLLYLAVTRQLRLLKQLHPIASTAVFLAIAAPWHILAALRNPPIPLPSGLGLPAKGGWAWFYLYNEHIARFLGKRIPHDYGQTPVWLFWLFLAIWIMPWATFVPSALADRFHDLRTHNLRNHTSPRAKEAALSLILWTAIVLGFFSLSSRQEYYSLPAIPALALMAGGLLAQADANTANLRRRALNWHLYFLIPLTTLIAAVCGYFALTAPHAAHGTDISTLLDANPAFYNLSLGHLFDLTGAAMGLFRGPLTAVALSMLGIGLGSYLLRRKSFTYAANLTLATSMIVTLLAAHEGLVRFYPTLGSKPIAEAINRAEAATTGNQLQAAGHQRPLIILDGEMTSGSTLIFYTRQQVHLVDGRVNGLWYGSFWPDAPLVFETNTTLHQLWSSPRRIFLMTSDSHRAADLKPFGPVYKLASSGGKALLSNQN